ncbi:hypothetical protein [Roseibium aggregatum]|uniref:hypothetical protein n=1 Tax=Roseibium aggregatum TaxID=187304 RepID=UPI001672C44C|nr:hypothetical protein [Roseibium aggregatum]UFI02470.1 hypothetical protein ST40_021000 [Roseibium aggregatum]
MDTWIAEAHLPRGEPGAAFNRLIEVRRFARRSGSDLQLSNVLPHLSSFLAV